MNTKTLLAFSCLLAAAQARPAAPPSSSSCSLTCSGRNFWTGYKSGTTLQYAFEQKVELSSGLSQQKSLLMQVAGKASVEVHGDCEMVLTVDVQSTKTSKSPSEATTMDAKTLPKAMVEALKEPLRFSFEDGRIQSMCPSSSETRASLNFKRGLLSQLHLSIDSPDQEVNVREDDVLGNCWTMYKKLDSNKLQKTKDLSSCTSNFEVFPRQGVKFEAPETDSQWPTVVQGNLKCTIELDGGSLVIKENLCEEDRVLGNNLGEESMGERIQVRTSLKLLQKMPTVARALFEVTDRSNLNHRHKTGDKCHDSKAWFEEDIFHSANECLEKKLPATGTASGDFKALAKKTIEELCEETKFNSMLNSTAAKYADLVKYMRGITSQGDFSGLFDWVKNGFCSDNNMLQVIVYSAVPSVGSRQSVQVILNQLKGSEGMSTDSNTANWLVSGIAMMPHPTPDIISDVLDYAKKSKEDSMVVIAKEPALALSAVTGRYCGINTNCESNEAVSNVLKFFSGALGTNCSSLESQEDQAAFDYAFASLLSIGNIGRATGGSSAIIGCAENSKLSLAHRAFALRSLRRFPDLSTVEKMRLGRMIGSKELDSELRITAYQAVVRFANASFWNDERVIKKLSDLMQDEREDHQVQHYIYSHLRQWLRKQRRMTDSYTVSNILRDYETILVNLNLNPMQVSNYWTRQMKNPSTKSTIELESNLIYSKKSIMPRFVNFNFTVESPLSGEAINMFEIGLRMEGMEGMLEQVFNVLNKDDTRDDELVRKRRQASLELREEQKQYKQTPMKQRFDIFTRKNGMELRHENFDDSILEVMPKFMKTLDFKNVKGLAAEKISNFKLDTVGQAAGTMMESTISIPTIAGFPILLKKELHYLTNIGFKQNFDVASPSGVKLELEVQPTASVHMARTVMVDSGFERAGVKSTTSGLTSTGMKMSFEGKANGLTDFLISFKLDPLKKQQKILELKTDVVFVQHSGPNTVIESPVVSPSEITPVTMKCFTPATVKLLGRRMCLESNFERTYNPMEFVRQNPGSLRLYVDKDDSFGVYEATLQLKTDGRNCDVLAVLGDQKSPDRHAKFQFSLSRSPESRKIVVELANPVLPIKWVSERKAKGDGFDLTVDLKFGSTDYAFRGASSRDPSGEWKLNGNFYRKDKERQQIAIATKYAFYGLLKYLPLFKFDFTATTPSGDKLTFNHLMKFESNKLDLSCLASHEKSGSVVTSVNSRLQYSRMQRGAAGQTRALLYDMEVTNKDGKNFLHSFSTKVDRKKKDAADAWESTLAVNHKFKYGVTKENTVIDLSANLKLDETIKPGQLYRATGSGDLNYGTESGSKSVKLSNLRIVLGEDDVIDDHFNTKTLLLEYATESEGTKSEALVAVQVLPIKKWRIDNQCVYLTLKASKQVGSGKQAHAFELRHTAGLQKAAERQDVPTILQVANIIYANKVLIDVTHKFYPISMKMNNQGSESVIGHHLNITTYDAQTYFINTKYAINQSRDMTLKIFTTVDVNQDRRIQVDQSIHRNHGLNRVEYTLAWQRKSATGSVRIYTQDSNELQRQQSAMEIADYLRRIPREGLNIMRFLTLIQQFIYSLKMENGFEMTAPSVSMQVTNYIDMTVTNGVMMNFTRRANYGGSSVRRSIQIVKELDQSTERYRRLYKTTIEFNDVASLLLAEVVCTKSVNPQLTLSLSKVSLSGLQSPDFNVTAVGQLTRRFLRDDQIALHINVTRQFRGVEIQSKLKIVVDTAPWNVLNPALNVSLAVTSSGKSFNVIYDVGVHKSELGRWPDIRKIKSLTSELTLTNTFDRIAFRSYSGITTISSNPDELFNFVFKKTLDDSDMINFKTTLNTKMLYIGVKSDILSAREVSFKAEYKLESDGFIGYLSQIKFNVLRWDLTIKDKGRFKVSGRSGSLLFSTVYSGTLQISGLEQIAGSAIPMDKLDYSGILEAKTTGEFISNHQMVKIKGATTDNLALISSKLNYWPFEISSELKTPLWNIDHYGLNISASMKSPEDGFLLKAWIASPMKQSSLNYWHTYKRAQKFELLGHAVLQSDHLFNLKADKIESVLTVKGSSLYDHTLFLNLTTPYRQMQLVQFEGMHSDQRQMLTLSLKMNDKQERMLNFERNVRTKPDGTKLVNVTMMIVPVLLSSAGWKKFGYTVEFVMGSDYLLGLDLNLNDIKVATFDAIWLKSGTSYSQQNRFSVPSANLGFDIKGFSGGSTTFLLYVLRSGSAAKTQWDMSYKGVTAVNAKVELINGKITSGSGTAMGKTITFSSPKDGVIEINAASSGGASAITWSSTMVGNVLQNLKVKVSIGSKESCLSYNKQGQLANVGYGSCSTPNTIKLTYQKSNFWEIGKAKLQISIEHTTSVSNQFFHLLPEVSIPVSGISALPFKLSMDINNELRQGKLNFDCSAKSTKILQDYDLSKFPMAMKFQRIIKVDTNNFRLDDKLIVNYDRSAKTVDVQVELKNVYKITVSNNAVNIEATGVLTAGVAFTTEASTGKAMVEIKGGWRPTAGSQPCVLRLWRSNIISGTRFALEFVQYSGKEISIVSDVTNFKYTDAEFKLNMATTLSSTLIEKLRSANSVVAISLLRDTVKKNYTLIYQESFTAGGVAYYELDSLFMGSERRFPSTMKIALPRGYMESEFSYNFNPEYNRESYLRWSWSKYGENRNSYLIDYRTKDVSNHVGKFWRDFSLEISSPRRQIYLSESCKVLENGTVQTELQAFLNKRNSEGIVAVFNKDFTKTNVYKRSMQLTLPTRQVGYERVLKIDGNKLGYNITIFWDMHSALEKRVAIQFNRERERTSTDYYYYHRLDMAAPFLKNKISKEVVYERKENEFKLSLTHTQESDDKVTFLVNGRRFWDPWRSGSQKEINISFAQQKGDVKANVRITVETPKMTRLEFSTVIRNMKEVNIFTTVPSLSVDSHVRIRHVPFEEFSFACNHGATFSLRKYTGFQRTRVFLFMSNSKKEAGQLTLMMPDRLMPTWEATLDTGKGYMDPKSTLSFPIYEPTKVLVKASAGLSAKGKKIHFGVVNGPMDVKSSIKLWKPETVPAELDFFFVGVKLNADNTLGYASHWRIRRMKMKSPFTQLKEVLVDPWAKSKSLLVSTDTINKLLKPVFQSKANNIDTDAVLDLLTSISSNDIDSLRRWAEKTRENNEFLSSTIGFYIASAFYVVKSGVENWAASVKSLSYRDALPSDLGIMSGISRLYDAATNAINSIPVPYLWSQILDNMKAVSDQISSYFSTYVDKLDSAIRDRISAMTGGRGSSVLDMLYNAVSSVYPVQKAMERISTIAQQYVVCLWTAHVELATQLGNALQPFFINTLSEIPKVYDFFDNLYYEISQWGVYIQSLIQAVARDNVAKVEKISAVREALSPYKKNVLTSIGLLLIGDYSGAIRKFFNTDANVVREWRVTCDQACLDSGSFAAINGTLYIPIDFTQVSFNLRNDRYNLINAGDALRRFRYRKNSRRQNLKDTLEELQSERGIGGLIRRLLSPEHRTAEATGSTIKTFGGKQLNLNPCRYLLAHDFLSGDFTIYQNYTWDGRGGKRSDLLVRFFDVKATITNGNELKVNDVAVTLPLNHTIGEQSVLATKDSNTISVMFSGKLQNTLQVKCKLSSNTCSIRVHPLYHGRLNGAFGSNDGNPDNDLHGGSESEHLRLWVHDEHHWCLVH